MVPIQQYLNKLIKTKLLLNISLTFFYFHYIPIDPACYFKCIKLKQLNLLLNNKKIIKYFFIRRKRNKQPKGFNNKKINEEKQRLIKDEKS